MKKESWRIVSCNHTIPNAQFYTVQFKDFHVLPHPQPEQSLFDPLVEQDNLVMGQIGNAFGKWRTAESMPIWANRRSV